MGRLSQASALEAIFSAHAQLSSELCTGVRLIYPAISRRVLLASCTAWA